MSKNFPYSTVAAGGAPSPATTGTTLTVATGDGAAFYPGQAFIAPAGTTATRANSEVVTIQSVAGDVLTIIRAVEGSTARTVVAGDLVYQGPSARTWDVASSVAGITSMTLLR